MKISELKNLVQNIIGCDMSDVILMDEPIVDKNTMWYDIEEIAHFHTDIHHQIYAVTQDDIDELRSIVGCKELDEMDNVTITKNATPLSELVGTENYEYLIIHKYINSMSCNSDGVFFESKDEVLVYEINI